MPDQMSYPRISDHIHPNPQSAESLKTGNIIVMKDCPCEVIGVSSSKPGKSGQVKVGFLLKHLFLSLALKFSTQ